MELLNRNITNRPQTNPERILQFGGGNFLRAFCDWIFDVLNKETDFNASVVVVKPTEKGDYLDLKAQDGLFHLALDGICDGQLHSEVTLVESISRVIQPYNEWETFLKTAEQPEMRFVVSNTTEAGIQFSKKDILENQPAHEFPAKLTQWLFHRYQFFNGAIDKGMILLPCELIRNNGLALRKTVMEYAELWHLGDDFIDWIVAHNHFCCTLVDRIVSGFPKERAASIVNEIKVEDKLLVAGEYYHSWVIKASKEIQKELPFAQTNLNVKFVEDLGPYREMKVRVLNGAHTSLVPVGYLAGIRTVKESMDTEIVYNHVSKILFEEIKPTLIDFREEEVDTFIQSVLDRFKNPTLKHYLIDISLNSISKFEARLLPAFLDYTQLNETFPKRIAFSLACLIRFYKGVFNSEEIKIKDSDIVIKFFKKEWGKVNSKEQTIKGLVENLFRNPSIFKNDLSKVKGLVSFIENQIITVEKEGIIKGLEKL